MLHVTCCTFVLLLKVLAVLTVLAVLESTLPSVCLSYKIQQSEATMAVLTVLAVSAAMAVSVMTATPLKLNPPFSVTLIGGHICKNTILSKSLHA